MPPAGDLLLNLGDVTFFDYEIPEDIGPFGGTMAMAVHEFPGGIRTIQNMGAFPQRISWKGMLFGNHALDRTIELDTLRLNGRVVDLTYAHFRFPVVVAKLTYQIKSQALVEYAIEVEPLRDNSANNVRPLSAGPAESIFNNANKQLTQKTNQPTTNYTVPPSVTQQIQNFQAQAQTFLTAAGNVLTGLTSTQQGALSSSINAIQSTLGPIISGTDPNASAAASELSNILSVMQTLTAGPTKLQQQITVNNPNLYQLAALVYADASLWKVIADVNKMLDPLPIGQFTIKIPINPQLVPPNTVTFVPATAR